MLCTIRLAWLTWSEESNLWSERWTESNRETRRLHASSSMYTELNYWNVCSKLIDVLNIHVGLFMARKRFQGRRASKGRPTTRWARDKEIWTKSESTLLYNWVKVFRIVLLNYYLINIMNYVIIEMNNTRDSVRAREVRVNGSNQNQSHRSRSLWTVHLKTKFIHFLLHSLF